MSRYVFNLVRSAFCVGIELRLCPCFDCGVRGR